ncbi:MAG: hypothetical protein J6W43_06480 [Prevotella sp.]|nr:hypothetical protein [Prevotella sp.]
MKIKQKHLVVAVWLTALVVIACALLIFESDQLWKIQEKNLFLCSALFLKEQLVVPGGLLTWIGTWFTQFLYYPWLGVLLLCAWWLLLMVLIKNTFHIPDRWASLMLIPVAILLITNMDLGYWIYLLKLHGHFFISTIGTTFVVALLWGFRSIPDKYHLRTIYLIITCALGYPLLGIYGLAAALFMGIWSWRLSATRTGAVICSVVAILSVAAIPLFCYRFIYYQTNLANILWAELPLFYLTEEHHTYYIPYYLLALFFVILAVTYRAERQTAKPMKKYYYLLCQIVLTILLVGSVYTFWMKDENFHHELTMQHRISNLDWTGVLEEAAAQEDEPTRAIVMMRNLALSRIGRQGDDMFRYKNGSKAYAAPFGMRLMMLVGPLIYYQYGMLNYCNRLCMEMGVEFGFRAEDYQLLANCALLENDQPLARKYLSLLKQTLFFSDWAEQTEALLGHADLIAKDPERAPITHMLHYDNVLGGDEGFTERFLMTQLVRSNYTDDPIFQEQCLLATLWTKDIKQFWYHFHNYIKLHPNGPMPRYFQEAAYLYAMLEGRENINTALFDAGVKDTFERFMTSAPNYNDQDIEVARQGLYPFFGETYYFDYYTMIQLPEY